MTDEKLTPERAVRLLRAKGAELEAIVLAHRWEKLPAGVSPVTLAADIALVAQLLADHIELCTSIPPATEQRLNRLQIDETLREHAETLRRLGAGWQEEARGPAPGWKPEPRQ